MDAPVATAPQRKARPSCCSFAKLKHYLVVTGCLFVVVPIEVKIFDRLGLLQPALDAVAPYVVLIAVALTILGPCIIMCVVKMEFFCREVHERFDELEDMAENFAGDVENAGANLIKEITPGCGRKGGRGCSVM